MAGCQELIRVGWHHGLLASGASMPTPQAEELPNTVGAIRSIRRPVRSRPCRTAVTGLRLRKILLPAPGLPAFPWRARPAAVSVTRGVKRVPRSVSAPGGSAPRGHVRGRGAPLRALHQPGRMDVIRRPVPVCPLAPPVTCPGAEMSATTDSPDSVEPGRASR